MANVLKIHAGSVYTRNGIIHEWISSAEGFDVFLAQGLDIKLYLGISIEAELSRRIMRPMMLEEFMFKNDKISVVDCTVY